jgi:hypothetical protein
MFKIGDRVRINKDLDVFNLTTLSKGETGTVVSGDEDETVLGYVLLDNYHENLEDWDNVLHVFDPAYGEVNWSLFEKF